MNAQQYAQCEQAVADFLLRNHVKPGCYAPKFQEPEAGFEAFFSWRPCECCQRDLGGDRETYRFAMDFTSGETFEADICQDVRPAGRCDDDGDLRNGRPGLARPQPGTQ